MKITLRGLYNFGKRVADEIASGNVRDATRLTYEMCLRSIFNVLPHEGVHVVEEEWDTLVVMTGCRYDVFEEVNDIDGMLSKKRSQGTSLVEWLTVNFPDYYDDIVYVSGNPRISSEHFEQSSGSFRGIDHFHEVVDVAHEAWNDERNTVPPAAVTEAALQARDAHPNKRLIVHYLQPHAPWIGDPEIVGDDLGISYASPSEWFERSGELGPWGEFGLAAEMYSLTHLYDAYVGNVQIVLGEISTLVSHLDGKTVVTSDHGEAFGEKFIIEHPPEVYIDELVEVPWLVVTGDVK